MTSGLMAEHAIGEVPVEDLDPIQIRCDALDVEAVRRFRSDGYARVDALWSTTVADRVRDEARGRWQSAEAPAGGPRTPLTPDQRPSRQTRVATGPWLSTLHRSLVGFARGLSGRMLVPAFAAYGYYEDDDRVLLHVDSQGCDVTLLTAALGTFAPLHVHPELQGMTNDELGAIESDSTWDRESGVCVEYPSLGVTALRGQLLPHHRPGRPLSGLSAVAALHYRSLF